MASPLLKAAVLNAATDAALKAKGLDRDAIKAMAGIQSETITTENEAQASEDMEPGKEDDTQNTLAHPETPLEEQAEVERQSQPSDLMDKALKSDAEGDTEAEGLEQATTTEETSGSSPDTNDGPNPTCTGRKKRPATAEDPKSELGEKAGEKPKKSRKRTKVSHVSTNEEAQFSHDDSSTPTLDVQTSTGKKSTRKPKSASTPKTKPSQPQNQAKQSKPMTKSTKPKKTSTVSPPLNNTSSIQLAELLSEFHEELHNLWFDQVGDIEKVWRIICPEPTVQKKPVPETPQASAQTITPQLSQTTTDQSPSQPTTTNAQSPPTSPKAETKPPQASKEELKLQARIKTMCDSFTDLRKRMCLHLDILEAVKDGLWEVAEELKAEVELEVVAEELEP